MLSKAVRSRVSDQVLRKLPTDLLDISSWHNAWTEMSRQIDPLLKQLIWNSVRNAVWSRIREPVSYKIHRSVRWNE